MAVGFSLAVIFSLILAGDSSAKELRPADHGLIFQTLSPAGADSSPEMRSFFNSENSTPTMSSNSDVALPKAMNSGKASPPSWGTIGGGGEDGDRVGKVLTVASVVCGVGGAVLLVVSSLIYVLKYRKRKLKAARGGDDGAINDNDDENNKLQLVVLNP